MIAPEGGIAQPVLGGLHHHIAESDFRHTQPRKLTYLSETSLFVIADF
jgi:hypothetical protein